MHAGPERRRPPAFAGLSARSGRPRAAREIVEAVQGDIAAGRLPLGSRLPNERDLARHYGVSQPTIREAVRALDVMGLVDVRHGSGVYVTGDVSSYVTSSLHALLQIERVGILDVLELRALLGGFSARRAAERTSDDQIARMRAFLDEADAAPAGATVPELVRPAVSFQLTVSAAARNPLLFAVESFLIKLIIQLQLVAQEHHGTEFWRDRVRGFGPDRRRLLDFIAVHDQEGAAGAMTMYLQTQHTRFSSDPELAGLSVSEPTHLAALLDDALLLPDLRPQRS